MTPPASAANPAAAVVLDWGTFSVKAGLPTHKQPQAVPSADFGDAELRRRFLEDRLHVKTGEHPVVLGLSTATSQRTREELCQVVFEELEAPALFVGSTAFLSVLGAGLSTALVLDVGEAGARVVPVDEGYPLTECAACGGVGGATLSTSMADMMREAGVTLPDGVGWPAAGRLAKETLGCAATDFAEELRQIQAGGDAPGPRSCPLPGGGIFQASRGEGLRCAEALFDPVGLGQPYGGVQDLLVAALRLLGDINLRGRLLEGILPVGGSSMFPGFPDRLLREVRARSPWVAPGKKREDVQIHALANRDTLAWSGGAALAQCDVFRQLWTLRGDYHEHGAQAVHRMFV